MSDLGDDNSERPESTQIKKKKTEAPLKQEAALHNLTPAQLQQTYKTLKVILSDEETFHHVVVEIF